MPFNVLVLCTGNSARSILAEALLNSMSQGRIRAFSAGSHPKDQPNPGAIRLLERRNIDTAFARSKSWDEFANPDSPSMDLVVTVCDNAANETCPVWPGAPVQSHWGIPDPAEVVEPEAAVDEAFETARRRLAARVEAFLALPFESLDRETLLAEMNRIGKMDL